MMKVALITGAARGIGAATARAFAASGYAVAAVDVLHDHVSALVEQLVAEGFEASRFVADLSSTKDVEPLIDRIVQTMGRIDVLVNNAAAREVRSVRQITPDAWNRILATNLTAPAFLMKWTEPVMKRQGGGVIINVTSVEAHIPKGVGAAYAAAKGGLLSLTYDSAALLSGSGIRVVAVSPGAVDTDMGGNYEPADGDATLDEDLRAASEAVIPVGRWASPDEIARVIVWLAGSDASYITGTEITVDGGLTQTWIPRTLKQRILPGQFE